MDEVTTGSRAAADDRGVPTGHVKAAVRVHFPGDGRDLIYVGAGYSCHSPQEITPEPRHRVYCDPADRPDLFIVKDGEPPTRDARRRAGHLPERSWGRRTAPSL